MNHYDVLGVDPSCTDDEIKAAFRRLAKECHPDKTEDTAAHERMRQATGAWSVLRDPKQRAAYDRQLRREGGRKQRAASRKDKPKAQAPCSACGEPSFPGASMCWRCLLREDEQRRDDKRREEEASQAAEAQRQRDEEARLRDERARKRAEEVRKLRNETLRAAQGRAHDLNDQEKRAKEAASVHGYDDPIHAPDAEALLEAILSDSALRAARGVQRDGINVWVHLTPDMRIQAKGETVELVREVHKGLRQANRLFSRVKKWLVG